MAFQMLSNQIGLRNDVVVDEKHDRALTACDTSVSGRRGPRFSLLQALPIRKPSAEPPQQAGSFVTTVVVDHHNFKILSWNGLQQQTLQRALQL